jgi:hypothetical protein
MMTHFQISYRTACLFVIAISAQSFGISLLPKTAGFTNIGYAIAATSAFVVGMAAMARMIASGANMGILVPLAGAAIPLASIAIGILAYGERAGVARVALLLVATSFVALASRF